MLSFADRAIVFVYQDHADHTPNRRIGCQKRFVELGDRLSIARAFALRANLELDQRAWPS